MKIIIEQEIKNNKSSNAVIKLASKRKSIKVMEGSISEGLNKANGEYIGWAHGRITDHRINFYIVQVGRSNWRQMP